MVRKDDETEHPSVTTEATYGVQHDMEGDRPLSTTLITALADVADVDPLATQQLLYDVLDPDALNALFEPRRDGTPRPNGSVSFSIYGHNVVVESDGQITIRSEFARLKRDGGNLLVVGSVPDDVVDAASSLFLGDPEVGRTRLLTLLDRNVATVRDRLSTAAVDGDDVHVVNHQASARSASQRTGGEPAELSLSTVTGPLEDVRDETERAIDRFDQRDLEPAELRLCLDSLRPVVEEHDAETVEEFLRPICGAVKETSGIGHYVLPVERESEHVTAIESLFDTVVELQVVDGRPEQRWHLQRPEHTTVWFGL